MKLVSDNENNNSGVAPKTADYLKKTLPGAVVSASFAYGHEVIVLNAGKLRETAKVLRDELGFDMLLDIAAVDWLKWGGRQGSRFEADYFFCGVKSGERVQLKVAVPDDAAPELDSVCDLYPSANWAERECFDMMGVRFKGHPNLKRLLMWREFTGHPLRKDYPLNRRQPLPVQEDIL